LRKRLASMPKRLSSEGWERTQTVLPSEDRNLERRSACVLFPDASKPSITISRELGHPAQEQEGESA